jgi:mRNA interferase RelE/StbE
MAFELAFVDAALKEWRKLDSNTREQFRKKLVERCANPRVPSAKLSGNKDRYKLNRVASVAGSSTKSAIRTFL